MYLAQRLDVLRKGQNQDGGWPYYPGKLASWLEPTVFAALALHGQPEADRAWELIQGWQSSNGGWRPAKDIPGSNWTTALAVLLAGVRNGKGDGTLVKGLEWLRNNTRDGAWGWRRTSEAAAEPTALAILAIRKAGSGVEAAAEEFLLADKLNPETCGPALLGLQGTGKAQGLLPMAERWAAETPSPLTRAWITLGLRLNGVDVADKESTIPHNFGIVALEALAAQDGNYSLLKTGGAA
jgi:hypothetical protein